MGTCIFSLIYIILVSIQKNKKQKNKLTGLGAGAGALKCKGGTGGIRRCWGLSIIRLSHLFHCAAIRPRRGVFRGVSLSL